MKVTYDTMISKILITGVSGVGKSTIISRFAALDFLAIDTDDLGWIDLRDDGERIWNEEKIKSVLLSKKNNEKVIISGTVINQGEFYHLFDKIVLLTAPKPVIEDRILNRKNNPFGKNPNELENILKSVDEVEPLLRKRSDLEINTDRPIDEVFEILLHLFEA